MIYHIVVLSMCMIWPTHIHTMALESSEIILHESPHKKRKLEIDRDTAYMLWLREKILSHNIKGSISPAGLCYLMEYFPPEILCMITEHMLKHIPDDVDATYRYLLLTEQYRSPQIAHYHYRIPYLQEIYDGTTKSTKYTISCRPECSRKETFSKGERLYPAKYNTQHGAIISYIEKASAKFNLSKLNFIYKESNTIITGHNNRKTYRWNMPNNVNKNKSFETVCALMPYLTGQKKELNEPYERDAKKSILPLKNKRPS